MGLDSAFGARKTAEPMEGFTPDAFTWNNANKLATFTSADVWFEQLRPQPLANQLPRSVIADPDATEHLSIFARQLVGENPQNLIPNLVIEFDSLGDQKPIAETELGRELIRLLDNRGVTWNYNDRKPITQDKYIDWNLKDEGVAQWANQFGMPVIQRFRVYVSTQGVETLVWSAPILAATRSYLHETERFITDGDNVYRFEQSKKYLDGGGFSFGEWSEKIFIPAFAKSLFFLAETPFPSTTLVSMSRAVGYADVPVESHPQPFIAYEHNDYIGGPSSRTMQGFEWRGAFFPAVVHAGWLVTKENLHYLDEFLPVFSSGLCKISTIIDDGYLNFRRGDYPSPYDDVLLSACVFDQSYVHGGTTLGRSQWVPVTRTGILLAETKQKFDQAMGLIPDRQARKILWSCQDDGVGPLVAAAANNLIWYFFMPDLQEHPEDLEIAERILLQANRLEVPGDSVNAISNLGILHYMSGNLDRAIELFEQVLANPDDSSDNEAYFYLAHLYELTGQTTKAAESQKHYDQGEEYTFPLQQQLTNRLKGQPQGVKKFCTSCGQEFTLPEAKFCTYCGQMR